MIPHHPRRISFLLVALLANAALLIGPRPAKAAAEGPVSDIGVVRLNDPAEKQNLLPLKNDVPGADLAMFKGLSDANLYVHRVLFAAGKEVKLSPAPTETFSYLLRGRGKTRLKNAVSETGPGLVGIYPAGTSIPFSPLEPSLVIGVSPSSPNAGSSGFSVKKRLISSVGDLPAGSNHRETLLLAGGAITASLVQLSGPADAPHKTKTATVFVVTEGSVTFQFIGRKVPADADTILRVPAGTHYRFSLPAGRTASLLSISIL